MKSKPSRTGTTVQLPSTASHLPGFSRALTGLAATVLLVGLAACGARGSYARVGILDAGAELGPVGSGGVAGIAGAGGGGIVTVGVGGSSVVGTGGVAAGSGGAGAVGSSGGAGGMAQASGGSSSGGGVGTGGGAPSGSGGTGAAGGGSVAAGGSGGSGSGGSGSGGMIAATGGSSVAGASGSGGGGAGAGGASVMILSIDFVGGATASGGSTVVVSPPMAASEIAGVKPAANWNSAPGNVGSLNGLVLSTGTATTATAMWNAPSVGTTAGIWKNVFTDAPGDVRMMNGYLDPSATTSPANVTVGNLPGSITAAGYDVYVYMVGDIPDAALRQYRYTIASTTFTVTQMGPGPTSFTGYKLAPANGAGNYVVFRNLTAVSFTLIATPYMGPLLRAPVNGLQIVSPSGS